MRGSYSLAEDIESLAPTEESFDDYWEDEDGIGYLLTYNPVTLQVSVFCVPVENRYQGVSDEAGY